MSQPQTLVKQPSESRLFSMDFSGLLASGETVSGVTSATADKAGLVLGAPAFTTSAAQVRISGGTDGVTYKITFVVTTSLSNTLEGEGLLSVEDL